MYGQMKMEGAPAQRTKGRNQRGCFMTWLESAKWWRKHDVCGYALVLVCVSQPCCYLMMLFYDVIPSCVFYGCRSSWCIPPPRDVQESSEYLSRVLPCSLRFTEYHFTEGTRAVLGNTASLLEHCLLILLFWALKHFMLSSTYTGLSVMLLTKTHPRTSTSRVPFLGTANPHSHSQLFPLEPSTCQNIASSLAN